MKQQEKVELLFDKLNQLLPNREKSPLLKPY